MHALRSYTVHGSISRRKSAFNNSTGFSSGKYAVCEVVSAHSGGDTKSITRGCVGNKPRRIYKLTATVYADTALGVYLNVIYRGGIKA